MTKYKTAQWDEPQVSRFWAWQSEYKLEEYFCNIAGDGIAKTLAKEVALRGSLVIDFGCGPGFLTGRLLEHGAKVCATDLSQESMDAVNAKYSKNPGFLGAKPSREIDSATADVVVLAETIEHLSDQVREVVFREILRLLKPGAALFVTTPNAEDLFRSTTCCPECATVFHTVQHVQSFTEERLAKVLFSAGFREVKTATTLFTNDTGLSLMMQRLGYQIIRKRLPHLYAVARR